MKSYELLINKLRIIAYIKYIECHHWSDLLKKKWNEKSSISQPWNRFYYVRNYNISVDYLKNENLPLILQLIYLLLCVIFLISHKLRYDMLWQKMSMFMFTVMHASIFINFTRVLLSWKLSFCQMQKKKLLKQSFLWFQ